METIHSGDIKPNGKVDIYFKADTGDVTPCELHAIDAREALFFDLALEDLTRAADLFRTVYDETNGVDGYV